MIFVTVGTDGPFDRLIAAVDQWAGEVGRSDVYAQIGRSGLVPSHIRSDRFLEPAMFARRFQEASVVVSHAGMGTILTALHHHKPVLVMPRRASLGEQRNEHQLATARRLLALGKIQVAFDEHDLRQQLDRIETLVAAPPTGPHAQPSLIAALRTFITGNPAERHGA